VRTRAPLSFGIEEEFFVSHRRTRNVTAKLPARLIKQAQRLLGAHVVQHELLQCQLEIVSPILDSAAAARAHVLRTRRSVARIAAEHDYCLIAAGTHPLAAWHDQVITQDARYDEILNDFQMVGRRNLFCGLHIHVAIPPGIDRVQLMNRAMRWIPLFLAFSASSPFWNRHLTGLLSYRQAAYDEWPRSGIPDFYADQDEYDALTARLVGSGAMRDGSFLWWAIRPSQRYPTLELRIADACTHPEDTLALANIFRTLIAFLIRNPQHGAERNAFTRRVIDENRWRAKRYGPQAQFIDDLTGEVTPLATLCSQLEALIMPEADDWECTTAFDRLREILVNGSSAERQIALYTEGRRAGLNRLEALKQVVDWLAEQTSAQTTGARATVPYTMDTEPPAASRLRPDNG
jgi:carboxylate-amine ligase